MKKLFIVLFCTLLVGLCACERIKPSEETSTDTTKQEESTLYASTETTATADTSIDKTTTEKFKPATLSPAEIKALESGPFSNVLSERVESYDDSPYRLAEQRYVFYDIDGNGTKELLLGADWGAGVNLHTVCVIQDGVAVQQKKLFVDPDLGNPFLLYENGTIRVDRVDDTVVFYYYYFRFEGKEIKHKMMLIDNTYFIENDFFSNKDPMKRTPITKAEFDHLQKEMEGDGQVVELDWKPLAEYGKN